MTAPETTILVGDCRDVLRTLASDSVHTCVTSPPYYGLRDYGVANQIGLEATPDAWLATMVQVFREVRRVLRPDGTLWLNVGDSYASGEVGRHDALAARNGEAGITYKSLGESQQHRMQRPRPAGLKPKDLMLMPARLALALQADGWWVRSDIIWAKPNPMPESVTDRPTSSYEHVFLLSRSARYFYDADAVREDGVIPAGTLAAKGSEARAAIPGVNSRPPEYKEYSGTRNARNVWSIATEAFPGSHFATYPTELVSRCIRAGTSERGCCAACGAPWVREVERPSVPPEMRNRGNGTKMDFHTRQVGGGQKLQDWYDANPATTTGWGASCECNADTQPCAVLDPFGGSGTTGLVAHRLQRSAVLIELNPDYAEMARRRIETDAPLFTSWPPAERDPQDERMADLFAMAAD